MARIEISSETDHGLSIALIPADDPEGGYDAFCPLCPWTLRGETGYFPDTADAVAAVEVHVDHQHCPRAPATGPRAARRPGAATYSLT